VTQNQPSLMKGNGAVLRSPPSAASTLYGANGTALLPSATFKRQPSGLRKLSLPSSVAAQAAAEAIGTPTSVASSFGTPENPGVRRTPSGRGQMFHRGSPTASNLPGAATSHVDTERNSYFKRLSTLPTVVASTAIPLPVLKFVDATRGLLFALSQMHTALKQYILFTLDERISAQFNRILEVAGNSMAGLIRALDRFDSLSRKGAVEAGMVRAVMQACKDSVSTFRRVSGVLQLQLRPLQQTADVRYSRTFLLMIYGTIVELSNSWKLMAPHIEAVHPFLQSEGVAAAASDKRSDTSLTPIAEGSLSAGPRQGQSSAFAPPQRRRHAGSFSACRI
jgi:RAM signalling pathway protein